MSQTAITLAFEQHLADVQLGAAPFIPDEFVLANVPGLDLQLPIDRAAGLPAAGQIVHRQMVDQRGKVNANGVAYSIIMDTRIGNFTFNAMYLLHKASGLVAMVVHKEAEDKLKNQGAEQPGNSVVKSMLMEYQGAAVSTSTTVDASTWQIDFSSRLLGLDRDIKQHAFDHYGAVAFIADGFSLSAGGGVNEFVVAAGHGYIAGLRTKLDLPHSIVVASLPATIYADVCHAGSLLSDWNTILTIKASPTPLSNYVDGSGYQHYVTPLASLDANGVVTDLRGRGGLWWHEQRPQAHTPAQVGLDKIKNWDWSHSYTDATGGAAKYATGKAVADAYNALNSAKLAAASYTAADVLAKLKAVDGDASGLDADMLDGQHGTYYLAWANFTGLPAQATRWPTYAEVTGKPTVFAPAAHKHPWADITSPPVQATRWPTYAEITGKPTVFTPAAHKHPWADITSPPVQATRWPTYAEVTGKPTVFTPAAHKHPWADITSPPAQATRWPTYAEVTGKPAEGVGVGQSWKNVTASRSLNSNFTNTTGKSIFIIQVSVYYEAYDPLTVYVDGVPLLQADQGVGQYWNGVVSFIVPAGSIYKIIKPVGPNIQSWLELR